MFRLWLRFPNLADEVAMRYEQTEEEWTEFTYSELIEARKRACEHLGIEHRTNLANSELCKALGLTSDVFRPQRLIRWAKNA